MPRLSPVRRDKLIKVLRANGITDERHPAKHYLVMTHSQDPSRWTTIPDDRQISPGRLQDILKEVRKPRDEYLRILAEL